MKNSLLYLVLAIFAILWVASGQSTHPNLHRDISTCQPVEVHYDILVDIAPNYEFQVKKHFPAIFIFCCTDKQIQEKNPTLFLSDQLNTFHLKPPKWEPFHHILYDTADAGDDHHILS
jgi:hypothetical protein